MYPHERSLVKRLDGKPFALLGVNSDEDKDKLQQVMEKEQITWRSWWDGGNTDGPIQTSYNISHWPTLYLIDAKGVIRHIDLREEKQLDEAIDQLLGEQEADKKREPLPGTEKGPVDRVGDPLPPGAIARLGTVRFRHGSGGWGSRGLAFLPDGKTIVSASSEGRAIQFWEVKTGRRLRSLSTDEFNIRCFALSRDGKRMAVAGFVFPEGGLPVIGGIRLHDVETGKLLYIFPRDSGDVDSSSLVFTPDGKHLISLGNSGVVRIEEVASGKELLQHT